MHSGHFPQVAGALIPDNTQHFWRDDVGTIARLGAGSSDEHII